MFFLKKSNVMLRKGNITNKFICSQYNLRQLALCMPLHAIYTCSCENKNKSK